MNIVLKLFIFGSLSMVAGCQQKSGDEHDHLGHDHQTSEGVDSETQALYDEVMQIHDEVMPKMDDLYKAKIALKTRLTNTPNMPGSKKKEINNKIAELDSAGESMMVWMRQFDPLPDSLGEEKARAYLESEKKKVTKVKEDILQALEDNTSNTP